MTLQRAVIRQGSSLIDKQEIKTMRTFRLAVLKEGPDLPIFVHPGYLSRLALWLVEALRDKVDPMAVGRSKKKSLPLVIACLDEKKGSYLVVGVTAAPEFGDIRKKCVYHNSWAMLVTNGVEVNSVLPSSERKKHLRRKHDMHPSTRVSWRLFARTCKHSSLSSRCNNGFTPDSLPQCTHSGRSISNKLVLCYTERLFTMLYCVEEVQHILQFHALHLSS